MIKVTLSDFRKFVTSSPVSVKIKKQQGGFAIFVPVVQNGHRFVFCVTHNGKAVWPPDKALRSIVMLTQQPEKIVEELISNPGKIVEIQAQDVNSRRWGGERRGGQKKE